MKKHDLMTAKNSRNPESPNVYCTKRQRKTKHRIIFWSIFGVVFFTLLLNLLILPLTATLSRTGDVPHYDGANPYVCFDERPMLSAHRAGGDLAPEETLLAFRLCMTATEYRVDVVEFDLRLTADNHLVLLHDATADRTSNAAESFGATAVNVTDKTLAELKKLNFGENFCAPDGTYPYRGLRGEKIPNEVKILTLTEVLSYLTSVRDNLRYIIEIKDGGAAGERAADLLCDVLRQYGIFDDTIVGTFQNNVTTYLDRVYPMLTRSASISEVLDFYYAFLYGVKGKNFDFKVLQIPTGLLHFNLSTKAVIDYAHSYGIAVQYWTINDADEIASLVALGADAIMTDNPEVAYRVMFVSV